MGLFSRGEKFLGVDLGSTSIKIVELKKARPLPSLVTYGYLEKAIGDIRGGEEEEDKRQMAKALKNLCQRARVSTDLAVTALPSFSVFSSTINLSNVSAKNLKEAINQETKKIIPIPLEDAVLDWKILEKSIISKKENYRVLINVAAKKLVKDYMEIFKEVKLRLLSLEIESFALARSLIGRDPAITMIIDFSAVSTDIIIVEKMMPVFHRSINLSGINLTRHISQSLNLNFQKAEQFKRDLSSSDQLPPFIETFLKSIIEEINYSVQFYKNQTGREIEKIILSGGSSYLPKLDEYFSKVLNLKIVIGNPWKRISYPTEIEPALLEVAPRFSVAIGSALRPFSK